MIYPGKILHNRYQVIKKMGGGGFGQIFEVDDSGTSKVLKVLNLANFSDIAIRQKAIALFQREAKILNQIRHSGIPCVESDGYFIVEENQELPLHCLVMEKITGLNLQQWLKFESKQPLTTETALDWLIQLTQILQLLHQKNYFHRDIKPSNIMIKPDGKLVLVDFGAVREVTTSYLQQQKVEQTGTVIISPGYTPPEQAEGHAVPQSDFFALGRTFVYLLTLKSPIDLPKDTQTGELIWLNHASQVTPQLASLIDCLMAPFPGQRPQNTEEILQSLQTTKLILNSHWLKLLRKLPVLNLLVDNSFKSTYQQYLRRNRKLQLGLVSFLFLGGSILWLSVNRLNIGLELNDQGLANYQQGHLQTAECYYKFALLFTPEMEGLQYNLGSLYEEQQAWDKARHAYQLELKHNFDKAYNNLARLEILDGNYTAALTLIEKGLSLTEDEQVKYNLFKNLGWAQLELENYQQAHLNLQKAISLDNNRASAHCLQAQVWEHLEKSSVALTDWQNCLQYANPDNFDEQRWLKIAPVNLLPSK